MRRNNTIKNVSFAVTGQFFGIIISFVSRIFFLRYLGTEYLGINGLFTNILSLLTLAELGFATAITFSMYKPIAEQDKTTIKKLLKLYAKVYKLIALIILLVGISLMPFLKYLMKEVPNINDNITIIFALYLFNTVVSYLYSYKRSLIIADQKKYITILYRYIFFSMLNITQILVLFFTRNFLLFLLVQVVSTFAENLLVSRQANKMYPYIKEDIAEPLDISIKDEISRNVKAMFLHRVGAVASNSITSIIISIYVGIIEVGIYSNYLLVLTALSAIINLIFESTTASIGNLNVSADNKYNYSIFRNILFLNYWIVIISSISLFILFNPFIEIWLGKDMIFPVSIVIILVFKFYIDGIRKTVLMFRNAMGLFWYDRYKPIIEAVFGVILAIVLASKYGIAGILIGSLGSTIIVTTYIEPFVLYRYGFQKSVKGYFRFIFPLNLVAFIVFVTTYVISVEIPSTNIIGFLLKLFTCLIIPNVILYVAFKKTNEFNYFKHILISSINHIFKKKI